MLNSPLAWVGGKHRLREKIIARFPEHRGYIEVFSGAAWVMFGKPQDASRFEVINDLDGELVNFWRVVKHRPAEFGEAISWLLAARELWQEWRPLAGVGDEISRAVQFYAVIKLGFGAQRIATSFGSKNTGRPTTSWDESRADVREVVRRLRSVWIENLPWSRCLERFDDQKNFFYVDPPYRCGGSKAYAHVFTDDDHRALAATLLGGVRAKWLLSYNADPWLRKLYTGRGIKIEELSVPYSIARSGRQSARELLIRNY
jgi:DNA adenine methylase